MGWNNLELSVVQLDYTKNRGAYQTSLQEWSVLIKENYWRILKKSWVIQKEMSKLKILMALVLNTKL